MSGRRGFLKRVLGLGAGAAVLAADPAVTLAKKMGPGEGDAATAKALREEVAALRREVALQQTVERFEAERQLPSLGPWGFGYSATMGAVPAPPGGWGSGYQMRQMLALSRQGWMSADEVRTLAGVAETITARIEMKNGSVIEGGPRQTECCWGLRCQRPPVWYVYYGYDDDTYACAIHKADALAYSRDQSTTRVYRYAVDTGIDYSSVES